MTAEQIARVMKQRKDAVRREMRQTANAIGTAALKSSKHLMTEQIYSLPEDRTAKGEKRFQRFLSTRRPGQSFAPRGGDTKWRRTGHLRRSEKFDVRDDGLVIAIVNTATYAKARHEAGKPGHRKINPARESHWRDDMIQQMHSTVTEEWRKMVLQILKEHGG